MVRSDHPRATLPARQVHPTSARPQAPATIVATSADPSAERAESCRSRRPRTGWQRRCQFCGGFTSGKSQNNCDLCTAGGSWWNSCKGRLMLKRMVIMLVAVAVVFAAIFGFQAFKAKMIAQAIANLRNPPQSVSTMTAATQPWQDQLEAVGSTRAEKGADLSSQVSGIVRAIHFQSGARVEQGTLLVELDASDDIAKLDALKATAKLAQLNYDRDNRLLKTDAVSQQAVDTDLANLQNNQAQVAQQQALVDFKSVKAPFAGRLGIRLVDLGQYIAAGTPMVTLQHLDPIYVDFFLPQQALAKIQVGQQVTAKIDTWPDATFAGEISAIN